MKLTAASLLKRTVEKTDYMPEKLKIPFLLQKLPLLFLICNPFFQYINISCHIRIILIHCQVFFKPV